MRFERWTVYKELKLTGLRVQSLQCPEFFAAPKPRFADGRFQNADRFIVNTNRDRKRVTILATMSK